MMEEVGGSGWFSRMRGWDVFPDVILIAQKKMVQKDGGGNIFEQMKYVMKKTSQKKYCAKRGIFRCKKK